LLKTIDLSRKLYGYADGVTMTETSGSPKPERIADESSQAKPVVRAEPLDEQSIRQPETSKEARNMAMLCHLLGIVGFFAPLVIWLSEKDKHRFVHENGRAAMNYQISIMIYFVAAWLFRYVTFLTRDLCIGNGVLNALFVAHVVFVIMGAVRASQGKLWWYPIAIPFLQ